MGTRLSIVTVVLNAKEDLALTLKSLRDQKIQDCEFILIDGVSTDGTQDVINKHMDLIDHFVTEPDNGLYDAMNKGKQLASGDYIIFINAGDVFVNDMVLHNLCASLHKDDILFTGRTILHYADSYKEAPNFHHQSVLFPRSFYSNESYDTVNYKIAGEVDYILRARAKLDVETLDLGTVYSKLEGFGISKYSTINGMTQIHNEIVKAMKTNNKPLPKFYLLRSIMKYLAFKLGGKFLVSRLLFASYRPVSLKLNPQH